MRIQFDDTRTRTFEYPSEASMLLDAAAESYNNSVQDAVDASDEAAAGGAASATSRSSSSGTLPSLLGENHILYSHADG